MIVFVLLGISAYRREDISERRFRILAQNYDSLLAEQLLKDMEVVNPERARRIRERLPKMPPGTPKIRVDPGNTNPQEAPLETLLMLDKFRETKERGETTEPPKS